MNNSSTSFPDYYDNNSVRKIVTPSAFARKNLLYVQETGYINMLDVRHETRREQLSSFLLVVILSGQGTLTYHNQAYNLHANDCFLIDCLLPHSYQSSRNDPWEILWVHCSGTGARMYYDLFTERSENRFTLPAPQNIVGIIRSILQTNMKPDADIELYNMQQLVSLFTAVLVHPQHAIPENAGTSTRQKLESVRSHLEEHLADSHTLDDLSRQFFISKFYLGREFKSLFGKTIFQYILDLRVEQAKRLLRFSDHSIAEISVACGFEDQNYFAKQFKKAEGMTCSGYRKRWAG